MEFSVAIQLQFVEFRKMLSPTQVFWFSRKAANKIIHSTLAAITRRHHLQGTATWQRRGFKTAFQLLTDVTQASTTDANIGNETHEALKPLLQNIAIHE